MTDHTQGYREYREERELISGEVNLRDILLVFWRRRVMILAVLLIGLSLAAFAVGTIVPRYTAQALILLDTSQKQDRAREFLASFTNTSFDLSSVLTEIEILRSRKLAALLVRKLNLVEDPEFVNAGRKPSSRDEQDGMELQSAFKELSVDREQVKALPPEAIDRKVSETVSRFLKALDVRSVAGSSVVEVSFTSSDPRKAALVTNALVQTYIDYKQQDLNANREKLMQWTEKRLQDVRDQVFKVETEIEDYKSQSNVEENKKDIIAFDQLSKLNNRLVQVETEHLEITAQIEQLDKQNSIDALAGSFLKVINSPLIKKLQIDKQVSRASLDELSRRYGPKHPEIIKRKTEIRSIDKALDRELEVAKQTLRNEQKVIQARMDEINAKIGELKQDHTDNAEVLIKLREKTRESASLQLVLKALVETKERVVGQSKLDGSGIDVLSYANIPYERSYPNYKLIMALAFVMSFSVALVLAILAENVANVFRNAEQLENMFGLPVYAGIPSLRRLRKSNLADYVLDHPSSLVAEAVRTLKVAIEDDRMDTFDHVSEVVTVTSSNAGENKTALAIWLARLSAKSGGKVVLIDANLRDPAIHGALGMSNMPNLADYLTGQKKLDEVIQQDPKTSLNVICGQGIPNSAFDLLNSKTMNTLVESLRKVYDLIIFDVPPSHDILDAQIMSKKSDHTLYVVSCDKTSRDQVVDGVRQLYDKGSSELGFVLSNVKVDGPID